MNRGRGGNRGGGGGGRYYGSRGRSSRSAPRYVVRNSTVGAHTDDVSSAHGSGFSEIGRRNIGVDPVDGVTKKFNGMSTSDYSYEPNSEPHSVGNISQGVGNSKQVLHVPEAEDQTPKPLDLPSSVGPGYDNDFPSVSTHSELNARTVQIIQTRDKEEENHNQSHLSRTPLVDVTHKKEEPSQTMGSGFQDGQFRQEVQTRKNASEGTSGKCEYENSDLQHKGFSFDICQERNRNVVKLKPSLLVKNRAMRNEMKSRAQGNDIMIFRPGMILLKGYLPLADQLWR